MEGLYLPTLLLSGELLRVDLVEALWRFGLLTATVVVPYVPVGAYTALTERTDSPAPAESPEPTTGGEATDRQVRVALQNAEGIEDPDPNPDEGDDDPDSKRSPGTVRGIGVAGCLWTAAVGVLVAVEAGVDVPSAGLVVAALLVASVVPVAALGSLSEAFGIGADGFQVVVEAILEAGIYAFVTVYLIWSGANSLVRWLIGNSS